MTHYSSIEQNESVSVDEYELMKKKMRELKQRHRTDLEVKDNMIRALKTKVE